MRLLIKLCVAAFFAITSLVPAFAAEERTVPANRASVIFHYYTYYPDTCFYGSKPKFTVASPPEHGTVSAVWTANSMGSGTRHCKGKPMKGMKVVYKPHNGYRGPDSMRVIFTQSGEIGPGPVGNYRVNITVK